MLEARFGACSPHCARRAARTARGVSLSFPKLIAAAEGRGCGCSMAGIDAAGVGRGRRLGFEGRRSMCGIGVVEETTGVAAAGGMG